MIIEGTEISGFVFELFLRLTTEHVDKLGELAEALRREDPGVADLLQEFAQAQAGRALSLIRHWPSSELAIVRVFGSPRAAERSA